MEDFCQDYNLNCDKWKLSGECTTNPRFMRKFCPLSCGYCSGESQKKCTLSPENVQCEAKDEEHCTMKGCCWHKLRCFYPSGKSSKKILFFFITYVHNHVFSMSSSKFSGKFILRNSSNPFLFYCFTSAGSFLLVL